MLARLQQAAIATDNVFEVLMDAVRCCSLGQVANALSEVVGNIAGACEGARLTCRPRWRSLHLELARAARDRELPAADVKQLDRLILRAGDRASCAKRGG